MAEQNSDTSLGRDKPEVEATVKVSSNFLDQCWFFTAGLPDDMIIFHSGRLQYTQDSPSDFSQSNTGSSNLSGTRAFAPDLPANSSSLPMILPSSSPLPQSLMILSPSFLSLAQDPSIPPKTSRFYTDGRPPKSYNDLPNEIQLKILSYILKCSAPISAATRSKYSKALFLSLQLVDKRMCDQARRLYQQNRFVLVHGLDYTESQTPIEKIPEGYFPLRCDAFLNKILRVPHPALCHGITNLELRIFPQTMAGKGLLTDPYSFAPLFRPRHHIREAKNWNPFSALEEAINARRIAWQSSMMSVRDLKVTFDFARSLEHYEKPVRPNPLLMDLSRMCYDSQRMRFVALLNTFETAFPAVETVEVVVMNLSCLGRDGMWWRGEEGENRPEARNKWCVVGCARKVGMALEAALLRSEWEEL